MIDLTKTDIRIAREKLGYTQHQVAAYCGVSVRAYQNWERNTSKPTAERKEKLEKLLELKL